MSDITHLVKKSEWVGGFVNKEETPMYILKTAIEKELYFLKQISQ